MDGRLVGGNARASGDHGVLPVVINAVFALTDMSSITNCYSAELVFLLAGADIITMVWEITGVDKRIAAHSLALVGTSVRQQVVIWF